MELTVLTPTHNREKCLPKLFESLQTQSNKDFEWLIVDDGSSDNTEQIIREMIQTAQFPIRYIKKENGGKHTALNVGIKNIDNELTFIVDSDDALTPDCVESIYYYHQKYSYNNELCGYSFLRCFSDGRVNGKEFESNELIGSYIDTRVNSDDTHSDKAEVFLTKCLKEFPFPEYPGEKFLGEDIVWIRMGRKYKMVHINKAIYVGEYLDGGLTDKRRENNIRSPLGCMNRAKEFMDPQLKMRYRIKAALQYVVYGKFAGKQNRELVDESKYKGLVSLAVLPGNMLFCRWKQSYVADFEEK